MAVSAASILVSACGGPAPEPPIDATFPDAAIHFADAGVLPDPCDSPTPMMGSLTEPTQVMFDTTMTETRPRDLGYECGNVEARRWSRQEVIEYTVPGTGPLGLSISTVNMGTDRSFNTVIQVRTACGTPPTETTRPTCFDDSRDYRAEGGLMVTGGETLFVYITGHSDPEAVTMTEDEGRVLVTFEVQPNTAPTIASGRFILTPSDDLVFEATGTDAEGPPEGMTFGLFTARGGLDFNGDGALDRFFLPFDRSIGTTPDFQSQATLDAMYRFGEICRTYGCTEAAIRVRDRFFLTSAEIRVPMTRAAIVGPGATCNAMNACNLGLTCDSGSSTCVTVVGAGESCDASRVCGAGLACNDAMSCVDAAAAGEACSAAAPCETGLVCDATAMVCGTVVGAGASCDATHFCDMGLTCSATTMMCEAAPGP